MFYYIYKSNYMEFIFLDITLKTHNSSQKIAAYWHAISDSLSFTLYTSYVHLPKEYYP